MARFSRTARIMTIVSGIGIAAWLLTRQRTAQEALEPDIYAIPVTAGTYAYLLTKENPTRLLLVDTGVPGSERRILNCIAALGARAEHLEAIILTHWHRDHAGGLGALFDLVPHAFAYAHPIDAERIRSGTQGFIRVRGILPGLLTRGSLPQRPVELRPDQAARVRDLDPAAPPTLLADWGLTAIFTPGHTAGHIALYTSARGLLFAGDALGCFGRLVATPPLFDDEHAMEQSAAKLIALGPRRVFPGHVRPSPVGVMSTMKEISSAHVWKVLETVLGLGVRAQMS
jgi:glyoxylase-like metal-dependent hydrolase (beta-lactamase superfamily II)